MSNRHSQASIPLGGKMISSFPDTYVSRGSYLWLAILVAAAQAAVVFTMAELSVSSSLAAPPIQLTCPANTGTQGVLYSSSLVATGGVPPYTKFSIKQGSLPAGLTLNATTDAISGTPTASLTSNFMATVVDSSGAEGSPVACVITVAAAAAAPTLAVQSVTFKLAGVPGALHILNDMIGVTPIAEVTTPQWKAGRAQEDQGPVAYVSGSSVVVNVTFTVTNPPAANTVVFVTGSNATVGEKTVMGTLTAGMATFSSTLTFPNAFAASKTQFFDNNFQIAWSYKLMNAGAPLSANTSTNTLFVTLATPIAATKIYRTSLTLAIPPGGDATADAVFDHTWGHFSGPANATNWQSKALYYYREGLKFGQSGCSVAQLLTNAMGSGQCNSWGELLMNALAINGIASTRIRVTNTDGHDFMVKNWTTVNAGGEMPAGCETVGGALTTIQFTAVFGEMVPSPNGAGSTFYCDFNSQPPGIPGQNSPTPSEKVFIRHFIIMHTKTGQDCTMSDCYYDASYGVTFRSEAGFQNNAIFGFVRQLPAINPLKGRVTTTLPVPPGALKIKFTAVP